MQRALREAFLALPPEEYDWFGLHTSNRRRGSGAAASGILPEEAGAGEAREVAARAAAAPGRAEGREFYDFPGPLHSAVISPASAMVGVGAERTFRCLPRDRQRRTVEEGVSFQWRLKEGQGAIDNPEGEIVTFTAPAEPGLATLAVTARQGERTCTAEAIVTVTETLLPREGKSGGAQATRGLPGYTFHRAPGELWRSRYDERNNLVIVNNGHRDCLFAARKKSLKLKYIYRLFAKELVLQNFPGFRVVRAHGKDDRAQPVHRRPPEVKRAARRGGRTGPLRRFQPRPLTMAFRSGELSLMGNGQHGVQDGGPGDDAPLRRRRSSRLSRLSRLKGGRA